jgi:hypothetical protein
VAVEVEVFLPLAFRDEPSSWGWSATGAMFVCSLACYELKSMLQSERKRALYGENAHAGRTIEAETPPRPISRPLVP